MSANPLVSIIIPVYNPLPADLERSIRSVLDQTYSPVELIVVDDGSSDETAEVCRGFGDEICYIYQENQGVSVARNRGIEEAQGEYVGFLDADDWYLPNKLKWLVPLFETFKGCGVVTGAHIAKTRQGDVRVPQKGIVVGAQEGAIVDVYRLRRKKIIVNCTDTVLIKKAVLDELGGFRPDLRIGEDHELWARIAGAYDWCFLDRVVSVYDRSSVTSVIQNTSESKHGLDWFYSNRDVKRYLRAEIRKSYCLYRFSFCMRRCKICVRQGAPLAAVTAVCKAVGLI